MELLGDGIESGHHRRDGMSELGTGVVDVPLRGFIIEGANGVGVGQGFGTCADAMGIHTSCGRIGYWGIVYGA